MISLGVGREIEGISICVGDLLDLKTILLYVQAYHIYIYMLKETFDIWRDGNSLISSKITLLGVKGLAKHLSSQLANHKHVKQSWVWRFSSLTACSIYGT